MLCSFASPRATPSCSSGTPAVHVPPFALDSETPADHVERPRARSLPPQTIGGKHHVGRRASNRARSHVHTHPVHLLTTHPLQNNCAGAEARLARERRRGAASEEPRAPAVCGARRRRGGGRKRWHQLAAARPHVGKAPNRRRGAVGAGEARQACGGPRRRLMQVAVARPVDARHRRVIEPQDAPRAAPQAHRVNRRRRITLLIQPAEFSPSAERAEPTVPLLPRPAPTVFLPAVETVPHAWRHQPCVEVYPLT